MQRLLSLREIYQFVRDRDKDDLKNYYDKCYDTLKEMNKRSNLLTFFILILMALSFFPTFIKEGELSGFKFSLDLVRLLCPLLIPYFLLEWCVTARRRRELWKVMKIAGFKLFKTPPTAEDGNPFILSIHARNTIPFSLMLELLNVDPDNRTNARLNGWFIRVLLVAMAGYLLYLVLHSFFLPQLTIPLAVTNVLGLLCVCQLILFYRNEWTSLKALRLEDAQFLGSQEFLGFDLRKAIDNDPAL